MPFLPLDHPEPFAATLGVMLYPGTSEVDQCKARTFAARWLGEPLRRFHGAGHTLPYDSLAWIAQEAGASLTGLDDPWWAATAVGELLKTLSILARNNPRVASWNNAIRLFELVSTRDRTKGSQSELWDAKRCFLSVAHLWGAWCIREGRFGGRADVGYDECDDFQFFLAEAEQLREFGQTWRPPGAQRSPFLPSEVWRVPEHWAPPIPRADLAADGKIP